MANKSGYAGKIANNGTQKVAAVYPTAAVKGTKVTTGSDLRSKKK